MPRKGVATGAGYRPFPGDHGASPSQKHMADCPGRGMFEVWSRTPSVPPGVRRFSWSRYWPRCWPGAPALARPAPPRRARHPSPATRAAPGTWCCPAQRSRLPARARKRSAAMRRSNGPRRTRPSRSSSAVRDRPSGACADSTSREILRHHLLPAGLSLGRRARLLVAVTAPEKKPQRPEERGGLTLSPTGRFSRRAPRSPAA
jgi:hypothetical protein